MRACVRSVRRRGESRRREVTRGEGVRRGGEKKKHSPRLPFAPGSPSPHTRLARRLARTHSPAPRVAVPPSPRPFLFSLAALSSPCFFSCHVHRHPGQAAARGVGPRGDGESNGRGKGSEGGGGGRGIGGVENRAGAVDAPGRAGGLGGRCLPLPRPWCDAPGHEGAHGAVGVGVADPAPQGSTPPPRFWSLTPLFSPPPPRTPPNIKKSATGYPMARTAPSPAARPVTVRAVVPVREE